MKIKMINKLSVTFASFAQPHLIEALKKQLRDPSIGGLAGGEKHIIGNLFLKEATNNREVNGKTIYTDNINSAKSAEHELKSLRSIISTGVKNLNFPLMVLGESSIPKKKKNTCAHHRHLFFSFFLVLWL